MYDTLPGENLDERAAPDVQPQNQPAKKAEVVDKYAKNDARLKAGQKSYLAQFTIKPSYNVDQQSMTTAVNPTPAIDISRAEYFENPVVANLSPRQVENM